jgi:hypothetical protein
MEFSKGNSESGTSQGKARNPKLALQLEDQRNTFRYRLNHAFLMI